MKTSVMVSGFLRVALAGIFLWAGLAKASSPAAFAEGVAGFGFFPETIIPWIVLSVPVLEIIVAVLLLTNRFCRAGALLTGLLALAFALLFTWAGARGLEVSCSCFGGTSPTPVWWGMVRSGALLVAGWTLYGLELRAIASSEDPKPR